MKKVLNSVSMTSVNTAIERKRTAKGLFPDITDPESDLDLEMPRCLPTLLGLNRKERTALHVSLLFTWSVCVHSGISGITVH